MDTKQNKSQLREYKIFDSDTLEYKGSIYASPDDVPQIGVKKTLLQKIILIGEIVVMVIGLMIISSNISTIHLQEEIASYKNDIINYENIIANLEDEMISKEQEMDLRETIGHYSMLGRHAEAYSDSAAYEILHKCGAWYPDIIMAQLQIESARFTSNIGKRVHNGFGMKKISDKGRHRPTTQIPEVDYNGYGVYLNWQMSLIDRILWDIHSFRGDKPDRDKYLHRIGHIYAEDTSYNQKIAKLIR